MTDDINWDRLGLVGRKGRLRVYPPSWQPSQNSVHPCGYVRVRGPHACEGLSHSMEDALHCSRLNRQLAG
jgi:hypothetical protein